MFLPKNVVCDCVLFCLVIIIVIKTLVCGFTSADFLWCRQSCRLIICSYLVIEEALPRLGAIHAQIILKGRTVRQDAWSAAQGALVLAHMLLFEAIGDSFWW